MTTYSLGYILWWCVAVSCFAAGFVWPFPPIMVGYVLGGACVVSVYLIAKGKKKDDK